MGQASEIKSAASANNCGILRKGREEGRNKRGKVREEGSKGQVEGREVGREGREVGRKEGRKKEGRVDLPLSFISWVNHFCSVS